MIAELSLGMVLLVGVGLLIHSFERLTHVDPGFEVSTSFWHDGRPKPAPGSEWESRVLPVSPSYFQTLGMHLVRGRTFLDAENRLDAAPVIVINEALARRYFPGENPIGKRLTFGLSHTFTNSPRDSVRARGEIVGVVKNVQQQSLDAKEEPSTYFPFNTLPFGPTFLVRTSADLAAVKHQVRMGVLVGALLAAVATRTLEGLLFGVQPLELSTFLIVAVVLGGAATFASWLPARRAARVDPLIAMRSE